MMNDLLSLSRMARRIGVTQQWLRDAAALGQVPCLRAGSRYLFAPNAVEAALARLAANTSKPLSGEGEVQHG
jgi:hypothetical protein